MSNQLAPKLLAEFIGTFAFVFIGASRRCEHAFRMDLHAQ
jgi:glycerol uptake facilitator-like aquaporin